MTAVEGLDLGEGGSERRQSLAVKRKCDSLESILTNKDIPQLGKDNDLKDSLTEQRAVRR